MSNNTVVDNFLYHFGVKGMHWGARSRAIQTARDNRASLARDTGKAEKAYLSQTSAKGKKAALAVLQKKEKVQWENARTARSMKRGEQAVAGLGAVTASIFIPEVFLPAVVAAGVAKFVNRDSKQFKSSYPDQLKGVKKA